MIPTPATWPLTLQLGTLGVLLLLAIALSGLGVLLDPRRRTRQSTEHLRASPNSRRAARGVIRSTNDQLVNRSDSMDPCGPNCRGRCLLDGEPCDDAVERHPSEGLEAATTIRPNTRSARHDNVTALLFFTAAGVTVAAIVDSMGRDGFTFHTLQLLLTVAINACLGLLFLRLARRPSLSSRGAGAKRFQSATALVAFFTEHPGAALALQSDTREVSFACLDPEGDIAFHPMPDTNGEAEPRYIRAQATADHGTITPSLCVDPKITFPLRVLATS